MPRKLLLLIQAWSQESQAETAPPQMKELWRNTTTIKAILPELGASFSDTAAAAEERNNIRQSTNDVATTTACHEGSYSSSWRSESFEKFLAEDNVAQQHK